MNAPDSLRHLHAPMWRDDGLMRSLGEPFSVPLLPQPLPQAHWVARSRRLAADLGWADWLQAGDDALALLSGNAVPGAGTTASVYSGHQFGVWAGQLGDGRALLLGEADSLLGPMEVQLKGSGLTPFSRMGDGRAVLRSSIREFLCSEAMHALGIPTTRALALVGSPLPVRRETVETAAVVTRIAPSFLRFGHFEHFTHSARDAAALQRLADAVIDRFYPEARTAANPYAAFLESVARRTARLIAQWQCVGFAHGVMNTDNMSILGLTIDYGPFGFLDGFDPNLILNHSDHAGRYTWARQPSIALWNLQALAQALMPLIEDRDAGLAALAPYQAEFSDAMLGAMRAKLGLRAARDEDGALIDDLLRLMARDHTDFTITFRRLSRFDEGPGAGNSAVRDLFMDRDGFDAWALRYATRLGVEGAGRCDRGRQMNRVNPRVVLRNHLAEAAIVKARGGDFSEIEELLARLEHPFDDFSENDAYDDFPPEWARHLEVSCSS
jgi:uncharacterized protein YdiU (UPF0061 family)